MSLDDTTSALADDMDGPDGQQIRYVTGTVINVSLGAALDGEALLTVDVGGSVFQACWLDNLKSPSTWSYPPIGSVVGVLLVNSSPTILGVRRGAPPEG